MIVYPTHRSGASPQSIYDATKRNATTAKLVPDGNGFSGALGGIPFPIPQNGLEVFWNHVTRYRSVAAALEVGQAPMTAGGSYTLVNFKEEFYFQYYEPGMTEAALNNILLFFTQETTAPARLAGEVLLVQETLDQAQEARRAWVYNPGQRRVRRAPNVAFDNPGTNADNLRTADQFDMYNGSPQRYDWKLVGKKEMLRPLQRLPAAGRQAQVRRQLLKKNHINQDLARYELHRVWVVDSTLKPGQSHLYSRRTLYVDEDSWQILAVDCYDSRGQLYRVQEGHAINYYDLPSLWTDLELVMDLSNGRYLALGLQNEEPHSYDFSHQAHARRLSAERAGASRHPLARATQSIRGEASAAGSPQARGAGRRARARPARARGAAPAPPRPPSRRGSPLTRCSIAIAAAGERLVAVGDRGIIVLLG